MTFWLDFIRTLLYPSLAVSWMAATLLVLLYHAIVLRHRVTHAAALTYASIAVGYIFLSLATGLAPWLEGEQVLPYIIAARLVQLLGVWWMIYEFYRRLRD